MRFPGRFVSPADAYQTPLGMVPIAPKAAEMAKIAPLSSHLQSQVQRRLVAQSPIEPPAIGQDTPETWEHSLEVELPFLQRTLHDFSIVPVIFGQVDPKIVAEKILPFVDAQTLIVVSTDLSHYQPYEEAKKLDTRTTKAICELRADDLTGNDACGYAPVCTLIEIARRKGWKPQLLDYRNSGDTSHNREAVVGYAAIAFSGPDGETSSSKPQSPQYTAGERRFMLDLARKSVVAAANHNPPPKEDADGSPKLRDRRACFVTLTIKGELRGCIGSILPEEPLCQAVISRAVGGDRRSPIPAGAPRR